MLAFNAATDLHRQAMTWAEGILRLKIPEEELKELEKRKAAALIAAQTRLRDGSLQEPHLQTLVELVSDITRSQWQLLGQYQHNVFVQCKHIPSAKNVQQTETFQEPQNTAKHGSRRTTTRKKRKAAGVSRQNDAPKLARTHFSYPTKDHIILPSRESGGRGSSSRVKSPEIVDDAPIPRPGRQTKVPCHKLEDKIPCSETAPSKVTNDWDDDPMAIARLI
ncbi:hypothetical protein VFPPC_01898 [Pochonia chlamydosporia 170]|uniref:Uncharacterized protein n=1 Tax=Pochonia chlamydosporia 170 TaxID=1380566 RepID=A0A179G983_METCM|nr:hypothetical protein VFPPC_01898 [Pochonia chlamydosporia 170]OAQ74377.1 hypothetical protein VFPPC_01898 [Pochonia chlamydosporia 170]